MKRLVLSLTLLLLATASVTSQQHYHRLLKTDGTPAPDNPNPDLPPVPAGVLSDTRFVYEYYFNAPGFSGADIGRYTYSTGALSGREIGGEFHLFLSGRQNSVAPDGPDGVGEISIPTTNDATATTINWFGDITKGQRLALGAAERPIQGLYWDAAKNWLCWAYGIAYAGSSYHNPSIGCSVLAGTDYASVTAYGPWRTTDLSQRTRGYMGAVPGDLLPDGISRMFVGAPITSGSADSPFGVFATLFVPPTTSTPASTTANTNVAITTTPALYTDINNRQTTTGQYKVCTWTNYNTYMYAPPQSNPVQNGSGCNVYGTDCGAILGSATNVFDLDMISAGTYIRTPAAHGFVFFGQITDTIPGVTYPDGFVHKWYGPTQGGSGALCPHGRIDGFRYNAGSTGDATETMRNVMLIYDPTEVVAGYTSGSNATRYAKAETPVRFLGLDQLPYNANGPAPAVAPSLFAWGGGVYDSLRGKLYVSEINCGLAFNEPLPCVRVFTVLQN